MLRKLRHGYWFPPLFLQSFAWLPTRILLYIFCHFKVVGFEQLKGERQVIFAANHCSELDPILVTAAVPWVGRFKPFFYVTAPLHEFGSKEKYGWRHRLYGSGWFFKAWGAYPTNSGHHDYALSLERHAAILADGGSMCMFPEGRISKTGELQSARGGVAFLSYRSGVPVVPVAIVGPYKLSLRNFFRRTRTIKIIFGKPVHAREHVPTSEPSVDDFHALAQLYVQHIAELVRADGVAPAQKRSGAPVLQRDTAPAQM